MKYKIVLADDHQFLMEGIIAVLKDVPDIEITATAKDGYELMEAVSKENPDLVILDLNMPGYNGLQCLDKIKIAFKAKVMILSNYNQPELVEEVKKKNADGYLLKNCTASELKDAIYFLLSGNKYFPEPFVPKPEPESALFFDEFLKKYQLTKREVGIIRLICQEKSTRQIAGDLFLSELTVNTHRRNIFRKLDVKNIAGLMNFARENQLV